MSLRKQIFYLLPLCYLASIPNAIAQLQPAEPDPLTRIRDAAKNNVAACSATGETLCEQVAPKIVANAESDSTLDTNLRALVDTIKNRSTTTPTALEWAVAALKDAKVDVHTEKP